MITGGAGPITGSEDLSKSVEFFRTDGTPLSTCTIPDLPDNRNQHTQIGTMLCGGGPNNETSLSCLNFASNAWNTMAFKLIYQRYGHVSWQSKKGLVFIGGFYSPNTTELVNDEGSTEYFTLQQPTW